MKTDADAIVVGSGPGGAQAAHTLVDAGLRVLMLDAGMQPPGLRLPDTAFEEIRRADPAQHEYFLGDDFSGIPLQPLGAAPQVTPPRRHVLQLAQGYARIAAHEFAALESHALGGLGAAWGAVSFPLLDVELRRAGFDPIAFRAPYERVARRIGISGARDDLAVWRGALDAMQPALALDANASGILQAYGKQRHSLHRRAIRVGQAVLAALTHDLDDRQAHALGDMDFWHNPGGSVYRPDLTVQRLISHPQFTYTSGQLVDSFAEDQRGIITVTVRDTGNGDTRRYSAPRLVLAAGALGSTRIALRSLGAYERQVPFVCNTHLYVPCLHARQLGRPHSARCHSLAQLTMMHDPTGDQSALIQAQMYSYRSLLILRLLKESPLPLRDSLWAMRALAPSLVVWAVEDEDAASPEKFCRLVPGADDRGTLEVVAPRDEALELKRRARERPLLSAMRRLGCWPLRRVHPGAGSSLHYGGQFPFSERDEPFTTDETGRLRGTRGVYLCDGSVFRYLPAKGLTFTLMANADRVATGIAARGR